MAGGAPVPLTGTWGERLAALFVVVILASCGGILIQILMKGIFFESGKIGPINIKPCLTAI